MHEQPHDAHASHDVLDHLRPTVVVRRRVWEPPDDLRLAGRGGRRAPSAPLRGSGGRSPRRELVGDALARPEVVPVSPPTPVTPPTPPPRTVRVDATTTLAALARRLGVATSALASELAARGWFDVTARVSLSGEAVRAGAEAFGWAVLHAEEDA